MHRCPASIVNSCEAAPLTGGVAAVCRLAQSRQDLLSQVEEQGQTAELCSQVRPHS